MNKNSPFQLLQHGLNFQTLFSSFYSFLNVSKMFFKCFVADFYCLIWNVYYNVTATSISVGRSKRRKSLASVVKVSAAILNPGHQQAFFLEKVVLKALVRIDKVSELRGRNNNVRGWEDYEDEWGISRSLRLKTFHLAQSGHRNALYLSFYVFVLGQSSTAPTQDCCEPKCSKWDKQTRDSTGKFLIFFLTVYIPGNIKLLSSCPYAFLGISLQTTGMSLLIIVCEILECYCWNYVLITTPNRPMDFLCF